MSTIYNMMDYRQMFDLKENELSLAILDYPAGISSFNAEMHAKGYRVSSGDKHYEMSLDEMKKFSQDLLDLKIDYFRKYSELLVDQDNFGSIVRDWETYRDLFLADYEKGKKENRYQCIDLPRLFFDDQTFDIALCAEPAKEMTQMIEELCRVAKEVRIFPLQNEAGEISDALGHAMLEAQQKGRGIEVRAVHHATGDNAMLRIWATQCPIFGE